MSEDHKQGACIDQVARSNAQQALISHDMHQKFCEEREQRNQDNQKALMSRIDELAAKVSSGVTRLHDRLDEADSKRTDTVAAFRQEITSIHVANAHTSTRQTIMWAIGSVVCSVVLAGATAYFFNRMGA